MIIQRLYVCLLVLISVSNGEEVEDNFCEYTKNEYYIPQGDLCLKCDKCDPGLGLESIATRALVIDPVHGAMECQRCVPCSSGYFSRFRSFMECKACRNCTSKGRAEITPCTSVSNSLCGEIITESTNSVKLDKDAGGKIGRKPNAESLENDNMIVYVMAAVVVSILSLVSLIGMIFFLRRRVVDKNSTTTNRIFDSKNEKDPMLSSVSINMACDEIDNGPEKRSSFDVWKSKHGEVLLNNEYSMFLSKHIATENTFHRLGMKLGIPDNEIGIIRTDYSRDIAEQAYQTLDKWRKMRADTALVLIVLNCLIDLDRNDVVETFCNKYQ